MQVVCRNAQCKYLFLQLCCLPPLPRSDLYNLHSYSDVLMTPQIYPPSEGAHI